MQQLVLQNLKQEVIALGHLLVLCAILYDSRVSSIQFTFDSTIHFCLLVIFGLLTTGEIVYGVFLFDCLPDRLLRKMAYISVSVFTLMAASSGVSWT